MPKFLGSKWPDGVTTSSWSCWSGLGWQWPMSWNWFNDDSINSNNRLETRKFGYDIVGTGVIGSALSHLLTNDRKILVLVIERGVDIRGHSAVENADTFGSCLYVKYEEIPAGGPYPGTPVDVTQ